MKLTEFKFLPEYPDLGMVRLKTGDKFLTGNQLIAQKDKKGIGNEICYYLVTYADKSGKNISYRPVYDKLEE